MVFSFDDNIIEYTNGKYALSYKYYDNGPYDEIEFNISNADHSLWDVGEKRAATDEFKKLFEEFFRKTVPQYMKNWKILLYIYGLGSVYGDSPDEASKIFASLVKKHPNEKIVQKLNSYVFTDDYELDDDIMSQADEIYQEQFLRSLAEHGSDPYGDAEYARDLFLNKHRSR